MTLSKKTDDWPFERFAKSSRISGIVGYILTCFGIDVADVLINRRVTHGDMVGYSEIEAERAYDRKCEEEFRRRTNLETW